MISFIYVDGVKKYLEHPMRPVSESPLVRYGRWTKVRLLNEPGGLVVCEYTVPGDLFDLSIEAKFQTGGRWFSRFPDIRFEAAVA